MADELNQGEGGGEVVEQAQAPVEQSAPEAAPVQAPSEPQFDPRQAYESLANENRQFREFFKEYEGNTKKWQDGLQNVLLQAFMPEEAKRRSQPQPVTMDQVQRLVQEHGNSLRVQSLRAEYSRELEVARERHPDFFKMPGAERLLQAEWVAGEKEGKSVLQIVKEHEAAYKKALDSHYEARQKEYLEKKGQNQNVKPIRPGGVPKSAPSESGAKGFARIRERAQKLLADNE